MEDKAQELLGNLRLQEQALQNQLRVVQEQLLATQGAIQALEHLLNGDGGGPVSPPPEVGEHDGNQTRPERSD